MSIPSDDYQKNRLQIVSDGFAEDTYVYFGDERVRGIVSIDIDPINKDSGFVTATLTVELASLGRLPE